jgi:hypothetical protein
MAGLLLATILPNVAIAAGVAGAEAAGLPVAPAGETPVFRSGVTVRDTAWILVAALAIWFLASRGGKR